MRVVLSFVALLLVSSLQAQHFTRSISQFDELTLSRGVQATLFESDDQTLEFQTFGVDREDIIIENDRGSLSIKVSSKGLWEQMQENDWWVRVKIPYQRLEFLEVSTGAKVFSRNTIKSDQLDLEVTMGAEMDLQLEVRSLYLQCSMGGVVELAGTAEEFDVVTNMGAEIDARDLECLRVNAKANMGGSMTVNCTEEFYGKANMGAYIRVVGSPTKYRENATMGGDISTRHN